MASRAQSIWSWKILVGNNWGHIENFDFWLQTSKLIFVTLSSSESLEETRAKLLRYFSYSANFLETISDLPVVSNTLIIRDKPRCLEKHRCFITYGHDFWKISNIKNTFIRSSLICTPIMSNSDNMWEFFFFFWHLTKLQLY